MAAAAQTGAPPASPAVRAQQQGPAVAAYKQAAAGNGQVNQDAGVQFVKQAFPQIADLLTRVAKVIQVERPELMPLVVRSAGALRVLEQEFAKVSQGPGKQVTPPEPTANGSEGQANVA